MATPAGFGDRLLTSKATSEVQIELEKRRKATFKEDRLKMLACALTTTIWHIWAERNGRQFRHTSTPKKHQENRIVGDIQGQINISRLRMKDNARNRAMIDK